MQILKPSEVFFRAACERDEDRRNQLLINGCKILTENIAEEAKFELIMQDKDVLAYMIICYPLFDKSIELILESIINHFRGNEYLLINCLNAGTIIGNLEDTMPENDEETMKTSLDSLQREIQCTTYVEKINIGILSVKKQCISFVKAIVQNFEQGDKTLIKHLTLLTKVVDYYINNSSDLDILMEAMELGNVVKNMLGDPFLVDRFEDHVKKILNLKYKEIRKAELEKVRRLKQMKASMTKSRTRSVYSRTGSRKGIMLSSLRRKGMENSVISEGDGEDLDGEEEDWESESGIGSVVRLHYTFEDSLVTGNFDNSTLISPIDANLLDSVPKFYSQIELLNFFRKEENVDFCLELILTPFQYDLSEKWKEQYPDLKSKEVDLDLNPCLKKQILASELSFEVINDLPYYYFRSYKLTKALTLYSNFKFITNCNTNYVDTFFKKLFESAFSNYKIPTCHFDHIAIIIIAMLEKEPFVTQSYILRYNLPYCFFDYLSYRHVFDLVYGIMAPAAPTLSLKGDTYRRFWEYFKETGLLLELSRLICRGEDLPSSKKSDKYKNVYLGDFTKMLLSTGTDYTIEDFDTLLEKKSGIILAEEKYGIRKDIDRLFSSLKLRRKSIVAGNSSLSKVLREVKLMAKMNEKKSIEEITGTVMNMQRSKTMAFKKLKSPPQQNFLYIEKEDIKAIKPFRKPKRRSIKPKTSHGREDMSMVSTSSRNKNNLEKSHSRQTSLTSSKLKLQVQRPSTRSILRAAVITRSRNPSKESSKKTIEERRRSKRGSRMPRGSILPARILNKNSINSRISIRRRQNSRLSTYNAGSTMHNQSLASSTHNYRSRSNYNKSKMYLTIQEKERRKMMRKRKITLIRKPFILKHIVKKNDIFCLEKLYQARVFDFEKGELEHKVEKMDMPSDCYKGEKVSLDISLLFLEIFKQVETTEIGITRKFRPKKSVVDPKLFCYIVFERTDFEFYENILKNFLLKIQLCYLEKESSSENCGEIINLLNKMSEIEKSSIKIYRRKFLKICLKHFGFINKLIISLFTVDFVKKSSTPKTSKVNQRNLLKVKLLLSKLFLFVIKGEKFMNLSYTHSINETVWDTLVTWFFKHQSNNLYSSVFLEIMEVVMSSFKRSVIFDIIFKLNIFNRMISKIKLLFPNNAIVRSKWVDLAAGSFRKLIKLIFSYAKKRTDLQDLNENLANLHTHPEVFSLFDKRERPSNKQDLSPRERLLKTLGLLSSKKKGSGEIMTNNLLGTVAENVYVRKRNRKRSGSVVF